jgi:hypothetical protein
MLVLACAEQEWCVLELLSLSFNWVAILALPFLHQQELAFVHRMRHDISSRKP